MSTWATVLLGSLVAFALKFLGYVVAERHLAHPRVARATGLLPVALLAGLVAVQAFLAPDGTPAPDSRAAAVAVALVALALRAPFLLVVVLGAATAATLRAFGWP
ncbi:AzlD domain-containing protein [Agilicoccus flavus]|uniref:AzlD domain-containing protein n=1 Tax=Agilicoccus flavus TaxID=2775968 RepID=UPI001CF6C930|nr:AzlD domain-containing protein [Agilicoccus flavus]